MNAMNPVSPPLDVSRWTTHLKLPNTDGLPMENAVQPRQQVLIVDNLEPVLNALHPDGSYLVA